MFSKMSSGALSYPQYHVISLEDLRIPFPACNNESIPPVDLYKPRSQLYIQVQLP